MTVTRFVTAVAAALVFVLAACAPSGIVEDLGTLGGASSMGLGINSVGNVTGGSYLSTSDPHFAGLHAFRYVDGLGIIDCGALQPGNIGEGQGINTGGLVVGGSIASNGVSHAVRINSLLTITDLGTLGGEYSYAWDINDTGHVTGEASTATEETHAFLLTDVMRDLGTLGGDRSIGRSINNAGQVAGDSRTGSGDRTRAFRFTDGVGMINLGVLPGGANSTAYGINEAGQVVGQSDTGPVWPDRRLKGFPLVGMSPHAFLWTDANGMTDLGHLGGGRSLASAINNNGVVVGYGTNASGANRAFRWTQATGMIDLNTLLPSNSGWTLEFAWDVNDRGQITGQGLHNGAGHAFRYNPPEIVEALRKRRA